MIGMRSAAGLRQDWSTSPLGVGVAVAVISLMATVLAHLLTPYPLVALIAVGAAGVTSGYATSGSV